MSIPKKGSRKLEYEGQAYRWRIRKKPTYNQGYFTTSMTFSVELSEKSKSTLLVFLDFVRPDSSIVAGPESIGITPKHVIYAIQKAKKEGWKADEPGKTFEIFIRKEELVIL